MCLVLRYNHKQPFHDKTKYRWKVCVEKNIFRKYTSTRRSNVITGCYRDFFEYKKKGWNKNIGRDTDAPIGTHRGFHVFTNKKQATRFVNGKLRLYSKKLHLRRVKVRGFIYSGYFDNINPTMRMNSETWRAFKFA